MTIFALLESFLHRKPHQIVLTIFGRTHYAERYFAESVAAIFMHTVFKLNWQSPEDHFNKDRQNTLRMEVSSVEMQMEMWIEASVECIIFAGL